MSFLSFEQCNPQRLQGSLGRLHWEAQNPAIRGFPGFPFCLLDLGPLLGAMKSRRAKLEEQKCLPSAEGFCSLRRAQGAARPLEPQAGVPPAPHAHKRLRRPCRGLSPRGRGAGEERPDTLPAGLGRSGRVKGPCPRPYGAAGRTNPLTRPSLEKRARGPRRGLRGTAGVDGGQGSRSDRAAAWP